MVFDARVGMQSTQKPNGDRLFFPSAVVDDGTPDVEDDAEADCDVDLHAWPDTLPAFGLSAVVDEGKAVYQAVRC